MVKEQVKAQKLQKPKHQRLIEERSEKVREHLEKDRLDAFLISSSANRFYLTGWHADAESGFVLITPNSSFILTDSRYTEHAINQTNDFEVLEYESSVAAFFGDLSKKLNLKRIGFESHDLSVFSFKRLKRYSSKVKFVPMAHLIEDIRSIKDEVEISLLKKAVAIADKAFTHVLNIIKPGMTEGEVAWEMEKFLRDEGAERMAWEPFIVASGANSSMAHWGASNKKIAKNDMVLVDYGCVWKGYRSDTSRVVFVGEPTDEQRTVYNLVLEAQKLGESLIKEGRVGSTIDKKVHKFLEKHTKHFYRHSLGHGVGLEIHEEPRLSINSKNKLQAGNVLTVEPGIYIPAWGGVRIEDMVVVTKDGCDILTKAPKDIKEVTI